MLKKINQTELEQYISDHALWLSSARKNGRTFSVIDLDFSNLDFKRAVLVGGNLVNCRFDNCDLSYTDLESINISNSDFTGANLAFANLRRTDAKYCTFDFANLENAIVDGMMLDQASFEVFKERISAEDAASIQIIDKNNVSFILKYEDEVQQHIAEEMLSLFVESVKHKHNLHDSNIRMQGSRVICTIGTANDTQKTTLLADKEVLVNYFMTGAGLENFTQDKTEQRMIAWRAERILSDARMYKELADERKLQLAEKHNDVVYLKRENEDLRSIRKSYEIMALQMQQQNLLLTQAPNSTAIVRLSIENGNIITLDTNEIIYAEIDEKGKTVIHLNTADEPLVLLRTTTFKELGEKIAAANKWIFSCHRNFILNVKCVKTEMKQGNNIIVTVLKNDGNPSIVIIGQNHLKRYKELLSELI
jgi:DNA-binding LytR/AlgR family response regulator